MYIIYFICNTVTTRSRDLEAEATKSLECRKRFAENAKICHHMELATKMTVD